MTDKPRKYKATRPDLEAMMTEMRDAGAAMESRNIEGQQLKAEISALAEEANALTAPLRERIKGLEAQRDEVLAGFHVSRDALMQAWLPLLEAFIEEMRD